MYDADNKKLSMRNMRVTAMKSNRRVVFPRELNDSREHDLLRLKKVIMEETYKYKENNYRNRNRKREEDSSDSFARTYRDRPE